MNSPLPLGLRLCLHRPLFAPKAIFLRTIRQSRAYCCSASGNLDDTSVPGLLPGVSRLLKNTQTRPRLLLGIDPDINGALALVSWEDHDGEPITDLPKITVFDNPCEEKVVGKRKRRQVSSKAAAELVTNLVTKHAPQRGSLHVVLEEPAPNRLNGKQSWFSTGFSYGIWKGVLDTLGLKLETVTVRRWKADLQLNGKGKEGSRELALSLVPGAKEALKRKKDHGRAEALLIAAWGLGTRVSAGQEPLIPEESLLVAAEVKLETTKKSSAQQTAVVGEEQPPADSQPKGKARKGRPPKALKGEASVKVPKELKGEASRKVPKALKGEAPAKVKATKVKATKSKAKAVSKETSEDAAYHAAKLVLEGLVDTPANESEMSPIEQLVGEPTVLQNGRWQGLVAATEEDEKVLQELVA